MGRDVQYQSHCVGYDEKRRERCKRKRNCGCGSSSVIFSNDDVEDRGTRRNCTNGTPAYTA